MKRTILYSIFIFFGVILLTGCGSVLSKNAGTYVLEYAKYVGDPDTAKDITSIETLILNDDGTGQRNRDGLNINIEWQMDEDTLYLNELYDGKTIEYYGTIKDGKLRLFDGDKDDALTYEKVYNKE